MFVAGVAGFSPKERETMRSAGVDPVDGVMVVGVGVLSRQVLVVIPLYAATEAQTR